MVELRQFLNAASGDVETARTTRQDPYGERTTNADPQGGTRVDQVVFGHETNGDADALGGLYEDDPSFANRRASARPR